MPETNYEVHPMLKDGVIAPQSPTIDNLPPVPEVEEVEQASEAPATEVKQQEYKPSPDEQQLASSEERNFRNLRAKAERLEKERNEAIDRLRSYEQNTQQQEEADFDLKPNDLAEGKHISKVQGKIQALEAQLIETRLRTQYPDIDSVVSAENLAILQRDYPDLANTIGASKNLYSKAVSAYTIIKKMGINDDSSAYQQEKALAHKNAVKPKPLVSVSPQKGEGPLSQANAFANGLTDELKKQLHKEMMESIRRR